MIACSAGPLVGSGGLHVEDVTTDPFDAIDLGDEYSANLDVDPDSVPLDATVYMLELRADKNLIDFIDLVVEDQTLTMGSDLVLEPAEPPTIRGDIPVLRHATLRDNAFADLDFLTSPPHFLLELTGKSIVEATGDFESLSVLAAGRTRAELRGSALQLEIEVEGDDIVDSRLEATNAVVHMDGGGEVFVCVTGVLDVTVSGSGTVLYGCDPDEINETITGSGRVEPAEG